jgi:hypothetical protein
MFRARALVILLVAACLIVLSAPAFAAGEQTRLHVCNKGESPVAVAIARTEGSLFEAQYWVISGVTVAPQNCAVVYDQTGQGAYREYPGSLSGARYPVILSPGEALLGFGLKDTAGRFVSLRATSVPDFGKVVTRASRTLCVDPVRTPAFHTTDSKLFDPAQCAGLQLPGVSRAVPLTTAYHFSWPEISSTLVDNDYYLNITAKPATGEIDVTGGEGVDEDHPTPGSTPEEKAREKALQDALMQGVKDAVRRAADEEAKRKEAADPFNQAAANRAVAEARANSIDYAAEHTRNIGRVRELSQFTPDWLRTTEPLLYVRGTVSRVEPPSGPRQPARLYFKESPDNAFIACIPTPQIFNLQQYVGKHLEVRGRVSQSNCGGKVADVRIVNPAMILDLAKGTPSDEAVLPGMTAASSGNAPRAMAAIPIATRIRVSLTSDIDLQHAANGATFQGQLAAPIALPDGVIPQGAAVVLVHDAYSRLGISSVAADGKVWRISGKVDASGQADVSANVLRAGTTLVFAVAGTDAPVVTGR